MIGSTTSKSLYRVYFQVKGNRRLSTVYRDEDIVYTHRRL